MENPLFKLTTGIEAEYGQLCMSGRNAAVTCYQFYALFGNGELMITRKDQFPSAASAIVKFLNKYIEIEQKDNPQYTLPDNVDEFIWAAEPWLMPTYGMQVINEIPVEIFLKHYEFIHDTMTGFDTWIEEGKKKFIYNNYGILKNGEEYAGNYRRFDPSLGLSFEKCFSVFDDAWKRCEYLGISGQFYTYLTWRYTAPQQT